MAQTRVPSGQIVSILPLGARLQDARTTALLKSEQLEVVRVVLLAGQEMREHRSPGEITVHCLEGRIEFKTSEGMHLMGPGDFIHLRRMEPHALRALEDASALVTMGLVSHA